MTIYPICHCEAFRRKAVAIYLFVIASPPKAGVAISIQDCFVASLLAMTEKGKVASLLAMTAGACHCEGSRREPVAISI